MTREVRGHETSTYLVGPASSEVDPGADITLRVQVSCPESCELGDGVVRIINPDGSVAEQALFASIGRTENETDEFVVKAPIEPGEHTWTAVFPAQDMEGTLHEESSTPFSFVVKPHTTTAEVLQAPDLAAFGGEFMIRVGVKCSAGCILEREEIEVYDHEGAKVATGTLGEISGSGPDGLFCAGVLLQAPSTEGRYRWKVRFPGQDLELPHEEAACTFAFGAARQPEHVVTIEVIDRDTKTPVKDARVLLRPALYRGYFYRSRTDEGGVARVRVPQGKYQLHVSGEGKESSWPVLEVVGDVTIAAELFVLEREWWED